MDICFVDERLALCFREEAQAVARWGCDVATQYAYVVNFLTCLDTAGDLSKFAFLDAVATSHPEGFRWTVRLTNGWRLVLEATESGEPLVVAEVVQSD